MTRVWSLVQKRFEQSAFDGQGAFLHGGRWNPKGYRCTYTSATSALAVLEILVNAPREQLKWQYSFIPATLPGDLQLTTLGPHDLPPGWQEVPGPEVLRRLGEAWLTSNETVGLQVPSPLAPGEMNVVLNPSHDDMKKLILGEPIPFRFDRRLA